MLNKMKELLSSELVARTEDDELEALWLKVYEDLERANALKKAKHEKVDVGDVFDADTASTAWEQIKAARKHRLK